MQRWPGVRSSPTRLQRSSQINAEKCVSLAVLSLQLSCLTYTAGEEGRAIPKTLHATEQDRPDVKAAREAWRKNQASLDPAHLVFIDETATATNMTRLRGRSVEGQRLVGKAPHGSRKITTFVAALRNDRITAPLVIDGAMNGETFVQYVEQFLVPTLIPNDIVVMDNLPVHKVAGVKSAIERASVHVVSSSVFSGPEPNRDGICQPQGAASKGGAHCRQIMGPDRRTAGSIY